MSISVLTDAIQHIRQHPDMYLRGSNLGGPQLASNIVEEALLLTTGQVATWRRDGWWIIASDEDWLIPQPGLAVDDLFTRIVPFPQAGANEMRREVLLTAFAHAVITIGEGDAIVPKGDSGLLGTVRALLPGDRCCKRVVAFQLSDRGAPGDD